MQNQPKSNRSHHQTTARTGIWLLLAALVVFNIVVIRFVALEHADNTVAANNGKPDTEEATRWPGNVFGIRLVSTCALTQGVTSLHTTRILFVL
jgi:hypothetical protein